MNFSAIPGDGVIEVALRRPSKLGPADAVVRVVPGPLRGRRWISGSSSHGCWLGSYECEKQKYFARFVRPGDVVLDVGAHAGYYTLLSSVLTGPAGRVIAFEPLPANVAYLRRHLALNSVSNAEGVEAAVSDVSGTAMFSEAPSTYMGGLDATGPLTVRTVALDDLIASGEIGCVDVVKIDVEGAEGPVLAGAGRMLRTCRPVIFLALHGDRQRDACVGLLTAAGYRIEPLDAPFVAAASEIMARPVGLSDSALAASNRLQRG